jgi:NADPH:quinone reductase
MPARRWAARDFGGPEVLGEIVAELPAPEPGEATVEVRAAGMNPADYKHFGPGQNPSVRRIQPAARFAPRLETAGS